MFKRLFIFGLVLVLLTSCTPQNQEVSDTVSDEVSDTVSAEHVHAPGDNMRKFTTNHTYTCECGEKIRENHSFESLGIIVEPTCTAAGTALFACKVCGFEYNSPTKPLGHDSVVTVEATASTCIEHGLSEKKECTRCSAVTQKQADLPFAPHTPDENGYCTYCTTWTNYDGMKIYYDEHENGEYIGVSITADGEFQSDVLIIPKYFSDGRRVVKTIFFKNQKNIKKVIIPENFLRYYHGNYSDCINLEEIVIPQALDPISTNCNYDFGNCINLKKVVLPDGITSTPGLRGCVALKSIDLPDSIERIGYYDFSGSGIERLELPKNLKVIENYAFSNCENLLEMVIPDSVKTIGGGAFSGCTSLKSIKLPEGLKELPPSLFRNTGKIEELVLPSGITEIPYSLFNGSLIENFSVPKGVTHINDYAFFGCTELREIVMDDTVVFIGNSVFENCENLSNVKFSNDLSYIGEFAFRNCALKEVDLSGNISSIYLYAFADCVELSSVTFSDTLEFIDRNAFKGCEKLFEISYEGTMADWAKVNVDVEAFSNSSVTKIVCSDGVIEL